MTQNPSAIASDTHANQIPWPPLLLAVVIGAAYLLGLRRPLAWPGTGDPGMHWLGLAVGTVGIALIAAAVMALRAHGTTVKPHGSTDVLVTSGPFNMLRNPIYLGDVLVLFGLAEVTGNIWYVPAGLFFALLVTALQILPEERHLEARFGDKYRAYKGHTRRWI